MSAVRLVGVEATPLRPEAVTDAVADPSAGAVASFVGHVRDVDGGKGVTALSYSAHPTAVSRLQEVCEAVAARHDVLGVAAVHRVGDLVVGDLAVVVAVSSRHRAEAFDACRDLIDTLKSTVPIWKNQVFADGTSEWVGLP